MRESLLFETIATVLLVLIHSLCPFSETLILLIKNCIEDTEGDNNAISSAYA